MRKNLIAVAMVVLCALAAGSCGGGSMPSSPSIVNPVSVTAGTGGTLRPREDPPVEVPDPNAPMPDPTAPIPDPAPGPVQVLINIIGTFGMGAFMPNPIMANMGDEIVFTNTDLRVHHIVMDDGTDLGEVPPGQTSMPMPLTKPAARFHCILHPSMIGGINMDPTPPYEPPPPDDHDDYYGYYGYDGN